MLVGAHRLVQRADREGATAIVFDTTGFVDLSHGGGALKQAKVGLLCPSVVFGIQRGVELEHLLVPLRRSRRSRVIELPPSRAAQRRGVPNRQEHRATRFGLYFRQARMLEVDWRHLAVFPTPAFSPGRLVALEDGEGFVCALGIVVARDLSRGTVTLYTPLSSVVGVDAIRIGDLALDSRTFRESRR